MAKEQLAVAELITNIILGKTEGASRVDFVPQKPRFPFDTPYEQPFPRATPESQGISSDLLRDLLQNLKNSNYTDMHHFMALRNGKVICEANFAPYRSRIWHVTHSMCKSITGMAIGLLVEEGKLSLDENIYDIFQKKLNPFTKIFRPVITVEHLLTMTSGVTFNESGIVSGNDWLDGYLNSSVTGTPGQNFQYNSLNTYVLSAIVTERTGQTLTEYLEPRLFAPLGITHYFWETCPKGITKGGWGLFLFPRSGLGFKYRLQLNNTVGVIDGDYYFSDNEGHIFAKLTNDSKEGRTISLSEGDAFIQGVFIPYGLTYNDSVETRRNGGFGSTDR